MYDGDYIWAESIKGYVANPNVEDVTDQEVINANARRIVACVNACAGISTERLETSNGELSKVLWIK